MDLGHKSPSLARDYVPDIHLSRSDLPVKSWSNPWSKAKNIEVEQKFRGALYMRSNFGLRFAWDLNGLYVSTSFNIR